MAQAFGGKVVKSDKGFAVGLHNYGVVSHEPWMDDVDAFSIPASHQDQVIVQPPASVLVAADDFTAFAALAYADHPSISFQAHPEFEPAFAEAPWSQRRRGTRGEAVTDAQGRRGWPECLNGPKRPMVGQQVNGAALDPQSFASSNRKDLPGSTNSQGLCLFLGL